jgi:nitrous oxidase accessory protein NosD
MAMISATCASIAMILASAPGGSAIKLSGDCPALTITRNFTPAITIDANGATVRGLTINGGGVAWHSGTFRASGGMDMRGPPGYAVLIRGGRDVSFDGTIFTDANRGLVIDKAENIKVRNSHFVKLREDGIIASASRNLEVTRNEFIESQPFPSTCTTEGEVENRVAKRVCDARGGSWKDGNHADAVQIRDAIVDAVIGWNRIEGDTQGIGQMAARTDRPLANVKVISNYVRVSYPHSISLATCNDCSIIDNDVAAIGKGKTVLRFKPELTLACGNKVANGGPGREPCPK